MKQKKNAYPCLKAEMVRKGIAAQDLCEVIGKQSSAVYAKLRGDTDFTLPEASKIREFLGTNLSLEELFD